LRWELGQAQFRAARYDDAEKTLLGIASRNPAGSPALSADALFYAARSQYRDGRVTIARRTLLDVARRFPGQPGAAKALYLAGDLDQDDGETDRAAERFRQAIATGADVEEVGLAHMRLANIAWQRGDYAGARDAFENYRARYPNGRRYVQATYWAGLSAARTGDTAAARARFDEVRRIDPFSYYGGRAADLVGLTLNDVPLGASPETSSADVEAVARDMARIDLLRDVGWTRAAAWEVERSRERFVATTGTAYALAEALNARGLAMTGITIGWDLFRRGGGGSNARLLRVIYPLPFRDIIVEEARERGVDPFLAAGLIRQESMFQPEAVSPAGAIGLMQVVPATGQALAGRLGVRRFDDDILKHAEFNVHLGMAYLDDQLAEFDGRLPVVLAAYNAGPHRITRWRDFPEFADDETFSERIPFAETRDYVKIVQNNARIYAALYGPIAKPVSR
ncbi:MAG: transglycosylase SLT domain-containing protein, partial [Gemmatimonadetes bacterium]|nr:transglycosylase SLT domain-containing protein [Gemmatimonadota bacterium]